MLEKERDMWSTSSRFSSVPETKRQVQRLV
nr:MAG TPA: hypothetical protein [Caudoviricetes sp.]